MDYNQYILNKKVGETQKIYSSYFSSNKDKFSEEIRGKLNKHFGFMVKCYFYWFQTWEDIYKAKPWRKYVIEELIKTSSIEEERREIKESDIKKLFDPWNCRLEKLILSFNRNQVKTKTDMLERRYNR